MNNLFSKRYSDLSGNSYADLKDNNKDLEAALEAEMTSLGHESGTSLHRFFEDVNVLKEAMEKVRTYLEELRKENEESKTVTRSQEMKALRERMDKKVGEILKQTKMIKTNLEELDKENIANRRNPGCEQGSSIDRTRMAVTNGLRVNLKGLMEEFQDLRQKIMSEYRQTVERRYFTVTNVHPDEATIDKMIETGESESFLQKAIQEQGRGQIIDTINEIRERHDAVKELEKNLIELHQIFLDMSVLVESQGEQLNDIEASVLHANSFVNKGTQKLQEAKTIQRNTRKWTCIAIIILLIIIAIVLIPTLITLLKNNSSSSSSTSG